MLDKKERLVKIIKESLKRHIGKSQLLAENIADDILDSTIIMLPCNLGDKVYFIKSFGEVVEATVISFEYHLHSKKNVLWVHVKYKSQAGAMEEWVFDRDFDWKFLVYNSREEAEEEMRSGRADQRGQALLEERKHERT